jgi:8-oxo-dGTP pyrophosphatase MutT (NUDIX family)
MSFFNPKRLSCGVIILNPDRELLLCHVTGQNHWDLPKGGIDTGESPLQAALRETFEETGLRLGADALVDLGRFGYTAKKDLHLFATQMSRIDVSRLRCESHYHDRLSGRHLPEMDGYGWFSFARVRAQCTPKMAVVLGERIDLGRVWLDLAAEQPDAEPFMMPMAPRTGDGHAALTDDAGLAGRSGLLVPALECGGRA